LDHVLISILRTSVSFFILMFITLWMGKQLNANHNYYNFALSVTIGSFIANMGFDYKLKFIPMLAALLALIFIYFVFSLISSHSRGFRTWLSGQPTVIIENGKILDANMKKIRYTLDDLNQQLREQGIFDIFEVQYALLEVSGKLSTLKKSKYQNITKKDFSPNNFDQEVNLPIELIMDGVTVEKNFSSHYSKLWLDQELRVRNLKIKDIQYAVISSNGSLFIDLYNDHLKAPLDIE
jgi:uncharacterized membrane protein YcaP (DUF421 family)